MSATFAREIPSPRRLPRRPAWLRRIAWPPLIAVSLVSLIGLVALLPVGREEPVRTVATRALRVQAFDDGAVTILDADTGAVAGTIPAGGESFVRGVLHGTSVSRRLYGVDQSVPYRLTALSDGRLTLVDAATHTTIDLVSFGSSNARRFAVLLDVPLPDHMTGDISMPPRATPAQTAPTQTAPTQPATTQTATAQPATARSAKEAR